MEQDPDITLQKITKECQRMLNIKNNNFAIEKKDISHVQAVRPKLKSAKDYIKPSPCYGCSEQHFKKDCNFKNKKYFSCVFFLVGATKICAAKGKIKIWKKTVLSKIKIFSGQWKIKIKKKVKQSKSDTIKKRD